MPQLEMLRFAIILVSAGCVMAIDLQTIYEWKYMEFLSNNATGRKNYDYKDVIPYDVQSHKVGCDRVWVTTPRFRVSNHPTVATISDKHSKGGPLLKPYPSWEWHVPGDCRGITNALGVAIDECNRLWVVDSGIIGTEKVCPAQILSFSLETDEMLTRYRIPDEVSKGGLLRTCWVETEGPHCKKTWVYAPDVNGTAIVIYDGKTAWRFESDYFKPDPSLVILTIDNESYVTDVGAYGIVLVDRRFVKNGLAAMWPLASRHMYAVSIDDLHNTKCSQQNLTWYRSQYKFPSQLVCAAISKKGVMFKTFATQEDLRCVWLKNPPTSENIAILGKHEDVLSAMAGMKISDDEQGNEELWIITNRYPEWINGHMDFRRINYRISVGLVDTLIDGTICKPTTDDIVPRTIDNFGFDRLCNERRCNKQQQ